MEGLTQSVKKVPCWKWFKPLLLAPLFLLTFSARAAADVEVGRAWATTPPGIGGGASAAEWGDATVTRLAHGFMRTMNDGSFLYVLLDVIDDTVNDPVPTTPDPFGGDYFALAFDVDLNRAVTPNVDLIYSTCQDGRLFIKSIYLTASSFTGCRSVNPLSLSSRGFGPTLHSATPHRYWEFRLDFAEIGVNPATWTTSAGDIQKVRANVATVSQNPRFLTAQPDPDPSPNLSNTFQIDLATLPAFPPGSTGPIFAGVGFVPANFIDSRGYANINIAGYYSATAAPWGGKLNIFGFWNDLFTARGVRSYRILYRKDGGALTRLRQTWTNFLFNSATFQWDATAIGPDADDKYTIPPPTQVWYLPNLLASWQSDLFGDGTYDLSLELFNGAGMPIPIAMGNNLRLFVVNTPPVPVINDVLYNGSPVCACAIVTQGADPAGFTFNISVTDARGALNAFGLSGIFGLNQSTGTIYSDNYSGHMNEDGPERWTGVTGLVVPLRTRFRAKQSCAYSFILSASSRSQNGYGLVFPGIDYHISLTILLGTGAGSVTGCTTTVESVEPLEVSEPAGIRSGIPPVATIPRKLSVYRHN